ncbi:E3 ubiquitin-protein ligase UPL5 [Capsicum annuum]|nr:E3 ubiquitin-protein ligase UPL5 [Capsicum annuum]
MHDDTGEVECYRGTIERMKSEIFDVLLGKMELSLRSLCLKGEVEDVEDVPWWSLYLVILKHLCNVSKLCNGFESKFWETMKRVKSSLSFLIFSLVTKSEDYEWLFEVMDFDARSHLARMMIPEVGENEECQYNMLTNRSELLKDSYGYIGIIARPEQLLGGLFGQFENEQATGPGVLREWLLLVCQAIFNPRNSLFVACPNDRGRFFPDPDSKVNPAHLEYFRFYGRMIALALMHGVQIEVVFDRVFFLQLSGKGVSLQDIRDSDPILYNSYKQILDMDPEMVDQDVLGLTFVTELEVLGSRKEIELCPNGKDTVVDSKNREVYVSLLIKHRFVTSIAEQVEYFAKGFEDLIAPSRAQSFFRCLYLDDLDLMLGGRSDVSIEDWKAHTDYHGYNKSDSQISWFWEIVERMSVEERKVLLFFWTSVKSLPLDGFGGLDSRLDIYKNSQSWDHLPSSQTCFYRMYFPPYQSLDVMQDRLRIITQEHVGCSFGTS